MMGVVESLSYATAAGLDAHAVVRAIGAGAAGSWAMNNLGPKVCSLPTQSSARCARSPLALIAHQCARHMPHALVRT
jgi:3-hydroxyisobutyrate dehydrogenase-like beta-hydroxyacid dehydrogenase